jgi:hypothetical protein
MSSSGEDLTPQPGIPEPIAASQDGTGEITMLPPEEAQKVAAEIRAIAEARGDDSQVHELVELQQSGPRSSPSRPSRGPTRQLAPITDDMLPGKPDDDALSADELRDAWAVLDARRARRRPAAPAARGRRGLLHRAVRPPTRRRSCCDCAPASAGQWMRLLEPDDVADVIQAPPSEQRAALLALLDGPTRKEVEALLAYEEDEAGGLMNDALRPAAAEHDRRRGDQLPAPPGPDPARDHLLRLRHSTPSSTCSASCRSAICSPPGRPSGSPRSWRPTWSRPIPTKSIRRRCRGCSPSTT